MGVDFGEKDVGFHEMDDVDFSDSDLVYHVREALASASSVSNTVLYSLWCAWLISEVR